MAKSENGILAFVLIVALMLIVIFLPKSSFTTQSFADICAGASSGTCVTPSTEIMANPECKKVTISSSGGYTPFGAGQSDIKAYFGSGGEPTLFGKDMFIKNPVCTGSAGIDMDGKSSNSCKVSEGAIQY